MEESKTKVANIAFFLERHLHKRFRMERWQYVLVEFRVPEDYVTTFEFTYHGKTPSPIPFELFVDGFCIDEKFGTLRSSPQKEWKSDLEARNEKVVFLRGTVQSPEVWEALEKIPFVLRITTEGIIQRAFFEKVPELAEHLDWDWDGDPSYYENLGIGIGPF